MNNRSELRDELIARAIACLSFISLETEDDLTRAIHEFLTAPDISRLKKKGGYWNHQRLRHLERVGYVRIVIGGDLRYSVPDGTVKIRPATRGRFGRPRKDKLGKPLRLAGLLTLLEASS